MATRKPTPTVLIALAAMAVAILPFLSWIPDDAYISFQYAQSLAEGDGLVFNPGEHVEGFSNLLWTLMLSGVAKAGADIARWAPWLGLLCAVLAVATFMRGLRTWLGAPHAANALLLACAAIVTGFYFPLAFYATSGLETPFYLLLLVVGVGFHLRARLCDRPRLHVVSCAAFFLAALTRPEGLAFLLVNGLLSLRHGDRATRLTLVLTLLAYAGVTIAKFDYYGAWLPNTYLAKPGLSVSYGAPLVRGLQYLLRFFIKSGLLLLLPLAWLQPRTPELRMVWRYLWPFAVIQIGFIVFVGADVLRFDRFTVPLFPWLLALAVVAARDRMSASQPAARTRIGRIAIVATVIIVALNIAQSYLANRKYCEHDWMHANAHKTIGTLLHGMVPDASVIVTNEIGAVRYYSRIAVVDMLGLTDATVAAIRFRSFQEHGVGSSPTSVTDVCNYLLARNPDVVLLPATRRLNTQQPRIHAETMHPLWYGVFTHPDFLPNYAVANVARIRDDKLLYIYLRNDIAATTPKLPPASTCLEFLPP